MTQSSPTVDPVDPNVDRTLEHPVVPPVERSAEGPRSESVGSDQAIISVRGVTKAFKSHTVLQDVTFDVPRGKTTAILGPSGTGKSVLL